jgi:hypothetical protein
MCCAYMCVCGRGGGRIVVTISELGKTSSLQLDYRMKSLLGAEYGP